MASLSKTQVDRVCDLIIEKGVTYPSLQVDLLDHLCCMIEDYIEKGFDFRESTGKSLHAFGLVQLAETQEATLFLLTSNSK